MLVSRIVTRCGETYCLHLQMEGVWVSETLLCASRWRQNISISAHKSTRRFNPNTKVDFFTAVRTSSITLYGKESVHMSQRVFRNPGRSELKREHSDFIPLSVFFYGGGQSSVFVGRVFNVSYKDWFKSHATNGIKGQSVGLVSLKQFITYKNIFKNQLTRFYSKCWK
jgi:hypothetical protein